MLNVYVIERIDNIDKWDSIVSMVVVAENKKKAIDLAFKQNWGDFEPYKKIEYLKARKINLNKEQIVLVDFLNG